MIGRLKTWFKEKKELKFWRNPEYWLAAIILNESGEQVYGKVKNGFAILKSIPNPDTGYSYLDIVKVIGPTGKQMFRDDEIEEFKAVEVYKKSDIQTFSFKIILSKSADYFELLDLFEKYDKKAILPWSSDDKNMDWRKGYCTADNLEQATQILIEFAELDQERKVKEIFSWNCKEEFKK